MDLSYNFLQDTEPSEAQLEMLMREVAEDVLQRKKKADANFMRLIHHEVKLASERYALLTENRTKRK